MKHNPYVQPDTRIVGCTVEQGFIKVLYSEADGQSKYVEYSIDPMGLVEESRPSKPVVDPNITRALCLRMSDFWDDVDQAAYVEVQRRKHEASKGKK